MIKISSVIPIPFNLIDPRLNLYSFFRKLL